MDRNALEAHYRAYIACINARKDQLSGADLEPFVHSSVTHNSRLMTRDEYCHGPVTAFKTLNNLHFAIDRLVVDPGQGGDNQQVACRIAFNNVRPVQGKGTEMLGLIAGKEELSFSENVIYRFEDGKIREVWSLLDTKAFEAS